LEKIKGERSVHIEGRRQPQGGLEAAQGGCDLRTAPMAAACGYGNSSTRQAREHGSWGSQVRMVASSTKACKRGQWRQKQRGRGHGSHGRKLQRLGASQGRPAAMQCVGEGRSSSWLGRKRPRMAAQQASRRDHGGRVGAARAGRRRRKKKRRKKKEKKKRKEKKRKEKENERKIEKKKEKLSKKSRKILRIILGREECVRGQEIVRARVLRSCRAYRESLRG